MDPFVYSSVSIAVFLFQADQFCTPQNLTIHLSMFFISASTGNHSNNSKCPTRTCVSVFLLENVCVMASAVPSAGDGSGTYYPAVGKPSMGQNFPPQGNVQEWECNLGQWDAGGGLLVSPQKRAHPRKQLVCRGTFQVR